MNPSRTTVSQRLVLEVLRSRGALTRKQLGEVIGLSQSGLSAVLTELRDRGAVQESAPDPTATLPRRGPGRPSALISLSPVPGFGFGVDVGHGHVRVALGRSDLEIIDQRAVDLDADADPQGTLETIADFIRDLTEVNEVSPQETVGCGVGLPAPINPTSGRVVGNNIVPRWVHTAPAETLREMLAMPVWLENDANLAGVAEYRVGAATGARFVIIVKVAAGVGLGMVVGGEVVSGFNGTAGEIGHLQVRPDGEVCRCGARGCLETVASLPRICAALEATHGAMTTESLRALLDERDPGAARVVSDAGRLVGRAVADLTTVLSPELVIVNGDLGRHNDLLAAEIRASIDRFTLPSTAEAVRVEASRLGPIAEVTGALHIAFGRSRRGAARAQA